MTRALCLAALAADAALRADAGLEAGFRAALRAQAASVSCAAQALGRPLHDLEPGWALQPLGGLPPAGTWAALAVPLRRGAEQKTLAVQVRLWPCQQVQVLAKAMAAGSRIQAQDLATAMVDARILGGRAHQGAIPDGSVLARPRGQGDPLLAGDLVQPPSHRAGDKVLLKIRFQGGEASDEGILLQDGSDGARIKAEHARSGRVVTGRLSAGALLVED